ncbi:DNA topoisomerase I [Stanieria cyanosphaera PCC 7437]|uniref:DNA topoisomerase 1 n=1 Tax=Stanieria cyanosphaera (strain ATCC 29371 / PCC 7437) TaxID=111780 RepID=K9XNT2_STAC7|nr:type I DNA topoisomerase [Stanieria cyanosphaera]AFZ34183.1 DNA topoisomerase I [Stanieria cyanosphaera PCC 7437]
MSTLVIVESPTKARTIRNYLPSSYQVEASMGHVRDLPSSADEIPPECKDRPWANLGVNVEDQFQPIYVIPKSKKKIVQELKNALKQAEELILATDEDREGESISWHLLELLKPKVPVKRMVFHEITREAIQKALKNCREVDQDLVHAQETRRILDRLYGYTLSPLLWKKIKRGLSAGRVQSVAVRLLVERERERRAFQSGDYWDLKAILEQEKSRFEAKLISLAGKKLATGSDFDPNTGRITAGRDVVLLNEAEANALKERLIDKTWTVSKTEEKATKRNPAPPFTTSTLQQEANRKLGISARETMSVAQKLYEQGYITYMRTDSVHLSDQAIAAARSCVEQMYGKEYLSPKPRQYSTKSKSAQEAHEAIRPAGSSFRTPQETGLSGREFALYDLIWKRTVASQMAEARLTQITVNIDVEDAVFRSSGKRIDFPGFFRAYVEGSDDPEAALENQEMILPPLKEGDRPNCKELEAIGHETQPPARYTEASLVKTLESEGVGRPSTYASIIGTIIDRGYVQMRNKALVPTFTAFAVTSLLEQHFPDLVDSSFTSKMEQTLDEIATGEAQWIPYLKKFYSGQEGLETQVQAGEKEIDPASAKSIQLENLDATVRIGKYGPYIEVTNGDEVVKTSIPLDLTPADLSPEQIESLIRQKIEGPDKVGLHPETGEPIFLLTGPYGPYLQLGEKTEKNPKPKQVSLPKGVTADDVNVEMAVGLLSLPRMLGVHPETGGNIKASLGRFGPYVVHEYKDEVEKKAKKDYRSLKAEDDVLTVSFERAIELLAQPKRSRSGGSTKKPLKELGAHPEDKEPVNVYKGPYGEYIKHGKVNVGLPEGETVESITLETAVKLLADKAGTKKTKSKSKTTTKTTAKKKTTKKKKAI